MNILEHYIKEIHSVTKSNVLAKYKPEIKCVEVDMTTDCHGHIKREKWYFTKEEWEKAKAKGYCMA